MELIEYTNCPRRVKGGPQVFFVRPRPPQVRRDFGRDGDRPLAAQPERASGRLDLRREAEEVEDVELEFEEAREVLKEAEKRKF